MSLQTPQKLRRLQRALYVKAKRQPSYRFYALYDKVYREDVLAHAWALCRGNGGAPGVDGESFGDIEAYGVRRWLGELREEVRTGRYTPQPVRRVMIPKPGGVGQWPLGVPTIRDRVVQTAAKLVLEPIFEAEFDDGAYGYRPGRSALQAVRRVHEVLLEGRTQVVDADLSKYFDTIPHAELMTCVARRLSDGKMLHLVKMWLKLPVEERDERGNRRMSGGKNATRGTPQGGVISPLLANIYMHRYIRAFRKHGLEERHGAVLVTYGDDFVVLCRSGAGQALDVTRRWMTRIGLGLNEAKTCVRDARCEPFEFLGYTFGPMRSPRTGGRYLGAVPSGKALKRLRKSIRGRLRPSNLCNPPKKWLSRSTACCEDGPTTSATARWPRCGTTWTAMSTTACGTSCAAGRTCLVVQRLAFLRSGYTGNSVWCPCDCFHATGSRMPWRETRPRARCGKPARRVR